ncbi:cardiolipin synthetase [Klebsiella pneumoniae]|uniref:Cardiolipin synthetase n=1 Tax=Klebsiella pneumoniae TaxID=573 RepID=A0A4P0Y8K1_KLEPN|nr:cardiolipin synthetase [Klebsiella pneumoniae]
MSIILPRKNDSLLVGWASRAFFTELLAAGVKIYQLRADCCIPRACWSMAS